MHKWQTCYTHASRRWLHFVDQKCELQLTMYNDQHSTLEEEEDFQLVHWLKQTFLKLTILSKSNFFKQTEKGIGQRRIRTYCLSVVSLTEPHH